MWGVSGDKGERGAVFARLHHWYYTPSAQATLLGLVFLLVFAAYLTIQAFAARTYGDVLASNTTVALYAVFTVACLGSPAVTLRLGPRRTLVMGLFGYVVLVLASLGYFVGLVGPSMVVTAGGLNGIGSALLWNAQGVLILQYSDRGTNGGTLFSIFWAFFNVSAILGGLVSFAYFQNETNKGLATLYMVFLCFILGGALLSKLLLSPDKLLNNGGDETAQTDEQSFLLSQKQEENDQEYVSLELSSTPNYDDSKTTTTLPKRSMLTMSVLFFYTGYKQPYQLVTFGDRYFDDATLGLEVVMFYFVNMLGGVFTGRLLDGAFRKKSEYNHRSVAMQCLAIFAVITTIGNMCALHQEWPCMDAIDDTLCVVALDYRHDNMWLPSIAYACWGITDAVVQTYCYWLMGLLCDSQTQQSRMIGFYVCVQSLGWCLGFLALPASRMKPMTQLGCTFCNFVLGTVLALRELPANKNYKVEQDDDNDKAEKTSSLDNLRLESCP